MSFPAYVREVSTRYLALAFVLPLLAAVVAIVLFDSRWLNLVHVVSGAAWAGATLYIAGLVSPTLLSLEPQDRAKVTVPLIPKNVLLISGLGAATLLTGATLAEVTGRDYSAPIVMAAFVVGLALLVIAGYLIRLQGQIYAEVNSAEPDMVRVGQLAARLGPVGVVGAVVQVVTLAVMALLRTGY